MAQTAITFPFSETNILVPRDEFSIVHFSTIFYRIKYSRNKKEQQEYIVSECGDLSVENVSGLNRIHIHAQCVYWSAGISYPHSRACPLIGSFLLGFTYCNGRERESDRNVIFRCSFIGSFFSGFHIVTTGYDTKEKEHQNTRQSD
jgi:hypothetical protein